MGQKSWIIRPYQPGDETQAVALFERCFGRSMSERYYRWKIQAGLGKPTNCMVALAGGRIVGHYASWRVAALIQGQRRAIMIANDGMVDPAYRRQGILTSLVLEAHQAWHLEGAAFVLALPNEKWGSVNARAGWESAFPLKWQIRPLRIEKILLRRLGLNLSVPSPLSWLWVHYWSRRLKPGSDIKIEVVDQAGAIFDELWVRLKGNWPLSIIRDSTWINWRYLSVPERLYKVLMAR